MSNSLMKAIPSISILIIFSLVSMGCSSPAELTGTESESLPSVETIKVGSSSIDNTFVKGKILPEQEVQIVSKLSGKVASVLVKEGSLVKEGEELIKLESDDFTLQVLQAQSGLDASQAKLADVQAGARAEEIQGLQAAIQAAEAAVKQSQAGIEQAKAAYDLANISYERTKNLFEQGAATRAQLDQANTDLERTRTAYEQALAQQKAMESQLTAAEAQLELAKSGPTANTLKALQADVNRAQTNLDLAENALNNTIITSPLSGIVIQRNIEPGEMATPGVPLLTIVKMDHVQIQASVPQDMVNLIELGSSVGIQVSGLDDQRLEGTIEFISPVSDPDNVTFPVKIKVDNQKGWLRTGMIAEVNFIGETKNKIEIPRTSLIQKDDQTYVYKVDQDTLHLVEVQAQENSKNWVSVTEGLTAGDQIVRNPTPQLQEGMRVQIN